MMIGQSELILIKKLYKNRNSITLIANMLHRSRVTIRRCLSRTTVTRRCHPPSLSVSSRRSLVLELAKKVTVSGHRKWKTFGSSTDIAREIERLGKGKFSARTISRDLRCSGWKSYVRPHSPCKSVECVAAKKKFAQRWIKEPDSVIKRIVFSDETWTCTNEYGHRREWIHPSEKNKICTLERMARWNVPSVMCWGCVGVGYKSPLIVFPSKIMKDGEVRTFRLDSRAYIRRCLGAVSSDLVKMKRILQHDGARSHISGRVKSYLKKKKINYIEQWPSNSPDFNLIEMIWPTLHARVSKINPRTQDELVSAVHVAWKEIPQKHIDKLCMSWKKRLRKFLDKC